MKSAKQFWLTVTGLVSLWIGSLVALVKRDHRKRRNDKD